MTVKNEISLQFFGIILYLFSIAAHLAVASSSIFDPSNNNAPPSLEEYCQTAPCRKNHSFRLKQKDGTFFDYTSELDPPVVQPAFILLFPGEEVFIEAREGKDAPEDLKHVPENIHPEQTLIFKFTQTDDAKLSPSMFLKVHNPFARDLRYQLAITPLGKEGLYTTSSCPVPAHKQAFEHWSYPIFQLTVADMHFLNKGDDMSCRK